MSCFITKKKTFFIKVTLISGGTSRKYKIQTKTITTITTTITTIITTTITTYLDP